MKMRIALACVLLVLLIPFTLKAQTTSDRDALRGIGGMKVVVEGLNSDAIASGLDEEQIRADVELRLRKAGINVFDDSVGTAPFLYVNIGVVASENLRAFTVALSFNRIGTFPHGKDTMRLTAQVWSEASLHLRSGQNLRATTRDKLADFTDKFINDYLAANPKP